MAPPAIWNARMTTRLAALHAKGLPYRIIAAMLSKQFDVVITRNAAIGKAHRIGLQNVDRPKPPKPEPAPPPRPARILRWKPAPPPPVDVPTALTLPFLHRTLAEIDRDQCHYPKGEGPYLYCGQPIQYGSSWCPVHHRVVYSTWARAK